MHMFFRRSGLHSKSVFHWARTHIRISSGEDMPKVGMYLGSLLTIHFLYGSFAPVLHAYFIFSESSSIWTSYFDHQM
jgi:hypothetical protein